MVQQTVKFILSPFNPNIESVANLVMSVHPPYNDRMVTLKVNTGYADYQENVETENPNIQVKQVMAMQDTDDTQTLAFDLDNNNAHVIKIDDKSFVIKLLDISKKNIEGQDFPVFEFLVTEQ